METERIEMKEKNRVACRVMLIDFVGSILFG
jgi:hypothetical protein